MPRKISKYNFKCLACKDLICKMGFEFPRITKCCFCVPLRLASLMIGYFAIIGSCLILAAVSFYIYKVSDYVASAKDKPNPEHSPEEISKVALGLYISFAYYMLVFLYNLVIHVLLVIGVHQSKPRLIRIYLNTAYFLFALAVVLVVVTCVFMGFIATIPMLKWAVVLAFCIVVVQSTCQDMEEQQKPRSFEMQNLYMPPQQQAPYMVA